MEKTIQQIHLEMTQELIKKALASPEDDKLFQEVISRVLDYYFTRMELAEEFAVTLPTVRRWDRGQSDPHPAMRAVLYKHLLSKIE